MREKRDQEGTREIKKAVHLKMLGEWEMWEIETKVCFHFTYI